MAEQNGNAPYWISFTLWLREGIRLAGIANKYMLALWQAQDHLKDFSTKVDQEEIDLLRKVAEVASTRHAELLRNAASDLQSRSTYPSIRESTIQELVEAFHEYHSTSEYYNSAVTQLDNFIQNYLDDREAPASAIMSVIWGKLGSATTPDKTMLNSRRVYP